MEHYGIIGWIVIGGMAGAHRQAADAGTRPAGASSPFFWALPARWWPDGSAMRSAGTTPGEGAGFVAAIVGAFLLLLIYRLIAGRRRPDARLVQQAAMAGCATVADVQRTARERKMKHVLIAALMLGAAAVPAGAQAQQASITQSIAGTRLDISATGEVTRVPDVAIITAGVGDPLGDRRRRASASGDSHGRVVAALKRAGDRGPRHPDQQHQPQPRIYLRQQPAAQAQWLYRLEPADVRFRDIANSGKSSMPWSPKGPTRSTGQA